MRAPTKRLLCMLMVLTIVLTLLPATAFAAGGTTLYLKPNANWKVDGARFAIYCWNNSGNQWVSMTKSDTDGIYQGTVPSGYSNIIFCRMNGSTTTNSWDNKWNQTNDLTIPTNHNCYSIAEGAWDNGSGSWSTYTPAVQEDITCQITLHFANTKNWNAVYAYTWNDSGDTPLGSWPGTVTGTDASGLYTLTYQATVPAGEDFRFIFNDGSNQNQTVDLSIPSSQLQSGSVERWIQPTTKYDDGNADTTKYNCDVLTTAEGIVQSPQVNGTTVTFAYKNPSASTVMLHGSMNGWRSGYTMTKNAYGIWSCTIKDLTPGIYTYKFQVDGSTDYITDPVNPWIMADDQSIPNSAFMVLDPNAVDTNQITVKLHYARSDGNYSGWNAWVWGLSFPSGQYDFVNEDGHMTATIQVPGRSTQGVYYKIRYSTSENAWASEEVERRVDLSDVVSGTVHCYVDSGTASAVRVLGADAILGNKIASVSFDYEKGDQITVTTTQLLKDTAELSITGGAVIKSISSVGSTYTLTLDEPLSLSQLYRYKLQFDGYTYDIEYSSAYATDRFAAEYTYSGSDLGASYTKSSTTFRVWAPTATAVKVNLYTAGNGGSAKGAYAMTQDVNGTWVVSVSGDLHKTYYTYTATVDGQTVETIDPYARTAGVNGQRGMVIDLDSTDPAGWENDSNPNPSTSYTDAVIYELHVRDFSIDDSSGILEDYQGKFLAFTQEGTTVNGEGSIATGVDYLKQLGITHLHLLPVYDYGSVDETTCSSFNWGYDPQNYNIPEGSYSTDPYQGEVRVEEFKQMVMALHQAGISVVMDVVYNHVYDAEDFCFNKLVPSYFSRKYEDGSYSSSSGCGNDTASEREMVRKYIIDSVLYWTKEYHIDGFRFDLIGLLDVDTVNQLVDAVHAIRPDVLFYGEGWTLGGAVEPGTQMATQANAKLTPNMAYFNDRIRDAMGGYNGSGTGFISGNSDKSSQLVSNFRAITDYTTDPQQLIQYISCHDNHTLMAKILLSTGKSAIDSTAVKMNNLAAAIYMTSQGVPFIHAGEEMLRLKIKPNGSFDENSYRSSDAVNSIKWDKLEEQMYADTSAYYAGLIAFRKAHPALRYTTAAQIAQNVHTKDGTGLSLQFQISGTAAGDMAESIYVIFNGSTSSVTATLPSGSWGVCIDANTAGTEILRSVSGSVTVAPISAMVLVQNQAAASVGSTHYKTVQAAVNNAKGQTVKLLQNSLETVTAAEDLYLDLNGKTLSALRVTGTLYGMDSSTDDYDCTNGYGKITSFEGSAAATSTIDGKHYLAVKDSTLSFHRYYVGMTHVTLRPAKSGIGYKAVFAGDSVVKAQLDSFGYQLWVGSNQAVSRCKNADAFTKKQTLRLLLQNIPIDGHGASAIHAQVYLQLKDGTMLESSVHSYSMQQLVEMVSADLEGYNAEQLAAVKQLCLRYPAVTSLWDIDALLNWQG